MDFVARKKKLMMSDPIFTCSKHIRRSLRPRFRLDKGNDIFGFAAAFGRQSEQKVRFRHSQTRKAPPAERQSRFRAARTASSTEIDGLSV